MAYHGYMRFLIEHLDKIDTPQILEVGVDRGVMFFALAHSMILRKSAFDLAGIDVFLQDQVKITASLFERAPEHRISLIEGNSLQILPKMEEAGFKFDVILLDGDHNYFTVIREMPIVDHLLKVGGCLIVDDYHGRWSERDLWYSERPGYENNTEATTRVQTEKQGVKTAVDEYLKQASYLTMSTPISGEPIVITKNVVQ